jgi:hypothetical protein
VSLASLTAVLARARASGSRRAPSARAASASMLDVQDALTLGLRGTVADRLEFLRTPARAR